MGGGGSDQGHILTLIQVRIDFWSGADMIKKW